MNLKHSTLATNVAAKSTRKRRFTALTLLFVTFFSFATVIEPVSLALAENGLDAGTSARVANTEGDGVRLRETPSSTANTMQIIKENETVTIKEGPFKDKAGNTFYKISYNGKLGYAMTNYLMSARTPSKNVKGLALGLAHIAKTDGDGANMRQQASSVAPVLSLLKENAVVELLGGPFQDKQNNNFYRVNHRGQYGYVNATFVAAGERAANSTASVATKVVPKTITTTALNGFMAVTNTDGDPIRFRSGPGRTYDSKGFVYEGQIVKVLGVATDESGAKWYKIEQNGYVSGTYLGKTDATATTAPPAPKPAAPAPAVPSTGSLGEKIANYAKQYVGWRYVWGGSSPAAGGFDCSGLVHWALTQNGIAAGNSVDADLAIGRAVALKDIQPGDVLIWSNTYKNGPSHSGIYLGGGKFVHAETYSTGVTIDNINDGYYAPRFYAARRPGA